jgi:hypothetical protein
MPSGSDKLVTVPMQPRQYRGANETIGSGHKHAHCVLRGFQNGISSSMSPRDPPPAPAMAGLRSRGAGPGDPKSPLS